MRVANDAVTETVGVVGSSADVTVANLADAVLAAAVSWSGTVCFLTAALV